jgi:hypothetical protein
MGFYLGAIVSYNSLVRFDKMPAEGKSRELNAKQALKCIRSGMSNADLMRTFRISPSGLADLLKQLFEAKLITENDLQRRGVDFKVIKKEPNQPARPPQPAMMAPPPRDDDEEFVDTVTLTEMLTFNAPEKKSPPHTLDLDELPELEELEEDSKDKRGKFNLGTLFKKT